MPHPILILPGIGGSVLVKSGVEKKRIFKEHVVDNRWMNIAPLSSTRMTQWRNDNAAILRRDNVTRHPLGITQLDDSIRAHVGIEGVCNLVPEFELLARPYQDLLNHKFNYKYFGGLVETALESGKFTANENLQALPFDFRRILDPHFREELFINMRKLIEQQGRPVVIVGHSLGAVLFKWFLSVHVNSKWAQRHVKRFFVVNAPFGGSNTALKAVMSGEYFVPIFSKQFHSSLQLNSGIIMCFPNEYAYLQQEALGVVGGVNLTLESIKANREGIEAFEVWQALYKPHMDHIMDPSTVLAHIVTCTPNLDTLKTFKLRDVGGGDVEEIAHEHGDGQVSARSLNVAYDLFDSTTTLRTTIDGCHHINIVSDPRFIQLVLEDALQE